MKWPISMQTDDISLMPRLPCIKYVRTHCRIFFYFCLNGKDTKFEEWLWSWKKNPCFLNFFVKLIITITKSTRWIKKYRHYCPIPDKRGFPLVWICSRNKLIQVGESNCQFYPYPPLWSFWQFGLTSCVSLFPYVCHLKKTVTKFHLHILLQFRPF